MRRRLLIAGAGLVGLLMAGFLAILAFYPELGAWAVRTKVLPRLESRLGRDISAGSIRVTRGTAVIEDLVVAGASEDDPPLMHIDRVSVRFDFWGTLAGDIRAHHAIAQHLRVHASRRRDGSDDLRELMDRLGFARAAGHERVAATPGRLGRLRPEIIEVQDASVHWEDEVAGLVVDIGDMDTTVPLEGALELAMTDVSGRLSFGPRARARELRIETRLDDPVAAARVHITGGELSLFAGVAVSSVSGSIENAEQPGSLRVSLEGSYGGADETLWQAHGTIDPLARTGELYIKAERFSLGRLSSILERSVLVDYRDTTVGARMELISRDGVLAFSGGLEVADANIYHPMLSEQTVRDIDLTAELTGRMDMSARVLDIERATLGARGVNYRLSGSVAMPGGVDADTGARREHARLAAHLLIPPVPCQTMLDGIPDELVPHLQEYRLHGTFKSDIRVAIDWADLDATELEGAIGIKKCRVIVEPEGEYGMDRLLESFTHQVQVERDQWVGFIIGPENPDFVPLWDVSVHLVNSLMTTEDSRFYEHEGFIVREFKTALIKNLKAGYFRYGASSITMQTVKNVILYREKTLSRKLQELFFTWHLENRLEKDRILEIYVNAIEFGPGIYGIGPAARHYFGKHPRDLMPVEAAFFSSILPSPKKRYEQYCEDRLWRWTANKIERILGLMHRRERLTDEEYEAARSTPLVFDRTAALPERECKRMARQAAENAPPTNPLESRSARPTE